MSNKNIKLTIEIPIQSWHIEPFAWFNPSGECVARIYFKDKKNDINFTKQSNFKNNQLALDWVNDVISGEVKL